MPSLWFVIAAYKRYDLSRVCFEQHARLCDTLSKNGVYANCVVVADDDNIRTAKQHGFATVNRINDHLGARYNDGFQFAAAERVDWVTISGSNTFIDPQALLKALPAHGLHLPYSQFRSFVHPSGKKRMDATVTSIGIRLVVSVPLLRVAGYRPLPEETLYPESGITGYLTEREPGAQFEAINQHPLEVLAFKSTPQLTSYEDIQAVHETAETDSPFEGVRDIYDTDLVDRVEEFYK